MASIQLYDDCPSATTSVSNKFIDQYMPEANGEFVKVYLYLLRSIGNHALNCSISAIADCFNHTEKDVLRALKYWERMHLIRLDKSADRTVTGIHLLNIEEADTDYAAGKYGARLTTCAEAAPAPDVAASTAPDTAAAYNPPAVTVPAAEESGTSALKAAVPASVQTAERKDYTADEIKAFCSDPDITELFFIIETYLKHPLSSADTNIILYWYDQLKFSTELVVYLVEYCISKGHSSMRYMNKVALGWHESNISTVEQAKENAAIHSQAYYGVIKALGITGRNLVDSEISFVNKWSKEYAFELPLIQEACSRTISAIHQPSFEYTDSILSNWHKNQVHTLEDVRQLDDSFSRSKKNASTNSSLKSRNRFNNFDQRQYDPEQLEKMLLTTSVK